MSGPASVGELIARVYQLYPRGLWPSKEYDATAENRRLLRARQEAAADYPRWQAVIDAIDVRTPDARVQDGSLHLFSSPGCDGCYSARLWLPESTWLPTKHERYVGFMVSFVVPYYVVYSQWTTLADLVDTGVPSKQGRRAYVRADADPDPMSTAPSERRVGSSELAQSARGRAYPVVYVNDPSSVPSPLDLPARREIRFDLEPDEEPYAQVIVQEIKAAYPAYEPMPEDVGRVLVPGVIAGGGGPGESTIFDCLFSHIM